MRDGSYRFSFLPVGNYTVQKVDNGARWANRSRCRVTLGNATTVNLAADGATRLGGGAGDRLAHHHPR